MTEQLPMSTAAPEPVFFQDGTVDQLVGMIFTLGMELSVLSARVLSLESAAAHIPPEDLATQLDVEQGALLDRLMANLRPDYGHARPLLGQILRKSTTPLRDRPVSNHVVDGVLVVERFLEAMRARDLSVAATYWGPVVDIVAVGGSRYDSLGAFVARSADRYESVAKRSIFRQQWTDGEFVRVLNQGELYGRLADGTEFDGVRYVDLFTLVEGRICRQEIFNDFGSVEERLRE